MNKRISVGIIILFVLVLSVHTGLSAHTYPGETPGKKKVSRRHMGLMTMLADNDLYDGRILLEKKKELGLTPEQEEKIESLMLDYEAITIRYSGEIKIKELRFASYLKSGQMDRDEVEKYIREISKEKTNMIVQQMNHLLDLKAILTPGQLRKMAEIREKWKARRKKQYQGK